MEKTSRRQVLLMISSGASVRNDIIAQGQVQVRGGLSVGAGGIFSDGNVGVVNVVTQFDGAIFN